MNHTETAADRVPAPSRQPGAGSGDPFDRIVCGSDGTDESMAGASQARRLAPHAPMVLVHVVDVVDATPRRRDYPSWIHARRDAGHRLLEEARRRLETGGVRAASVSVEEGEVPDALRYAAAGPGRPLLAIGSGDDTDRLLRYSGPPPTGARLSLRIVEAVTCSVLVARRPPEPDRFPVSITVGLDGSPPSLDAYRVAEAIAARTGARLAVIVALGGKGADLRALHEVDPAISISAVSEDKPAKALLDAASGSDLIVVGNRGLHGLRSLGSVSNRLVTTSPASVLVVRGGGSPAGGPGG